MKLYHTTDLNGLKGILKDNSISSLWSNFVSLSIKPSVVSDNGDDVILEFDSERLPNKIQVIYAVYWALANPQEACHILSCGEEELEDNLHIFTSLNRNREFLLQTGTHIPTNALMGAYVVNDGKVSEICAECSDKGVEILGCVDLSKNSINAGAIGTASLGILGYYLLRNLSKKRRQKEVRRLSKIGTPRKSSKLTDGKKRILQREFRRLINMTDRQMSHWLRDPRIGDYVQNSDNTRKKIKIRYEKIKEIRRKANLSKGDWEFLRTLVNKANRFVNSQPKGISYPAWVMGKSLGINWEKATGRKIPLLTKVEAEVVKLSKRLGSLIS